MYALFIYILIGVAVYFAVSHLRKRKWQIYLDRLVAENVVVFPERTIRLAFWIVGFLMIVALWPIFLFKLIKRLVGA